MAAVAHQALRYLLRSSGAPEVTTNDVLQALIEADSSLCRGFLDALSQLGQRDLRGCRVERESYTVDPITGKRSYRDFRISRASETRAIIETKIDSALTSADQAIRYLAQLADDGLLVLVTRAPLTQALASQAAGQLGLALENQNGVYRGSSGGRAILVLSWTRMLRSVVSAAGDPFEELLALDAAIEGITDFVPFTAAVQDTAVGQTVAQVAGIAERVCAQLAERLKEAGVRIDSIGRAQYSGWAIWIKVTILAHELWVGYDAEYWAMVPGDPEHPDSGKPTAAMPSPFWINRFTTPPRRAVADLVTERRQRLDRLDVARPLHVPLGAPEDAVVESLLSEATVHIRRISDALHADASASTNVGEPSAEGDEGTTHRAVSRP